MSRLYITDLDDTFLSPKGEVSRFSKETMNALLKKGLLFSVATARLITQTKELLKDLQISAPIVLGNGAMVYDLKEDKILYENFLQKELHKELFGFFKEANIPLFVMAINRENADKLIYNPDHLSEVMKRYFARYPGQSQRYMQVNNFDHLDIRGIVKLRTLGAYEPLKEAQNYIMEHFPVQTYLTREFGENGAYYALEVNHKNVAKHIGALKVKEMVGAKEMVCFGDEANDIPLFENSDYAYAVEGAIDPLKAIATGVIGSNKEDAVANFIAEEFGKE